MTSPPLDGTKPSRTNRANGLTRALTTRSGSQTTSDATPKGYVPGDEPPPTALTGNMGGVNVVTLPSALQLIADEKKKQEWASWVNEQFTKCKNARSNYERQWYINLAFVNGRHYIAPIEVPGQGFRLTAVKSPSWRVKLVVNKIRT